MSRTTRIAAGAVVALGLLGLLGLGGVYWFGLRAPDTGPQLQLPATAIGTHTPAGLALVRAAVSVDHDPLNSHYQAQQLKSWCGVASAVMALNALGADLEQAELFTPQASAVRSKWTTTTGGMALPDLAGLLRAHGREATAVHADQATEEAFRAEIMRNLSTPGDYLIVNYDRRYLGQEGGGHISPLTAASPDGNWVLILDTARYKYPPHWVEVSALWAAMDTPDSSTGQRRGWVVVR